MPETSLKTTNELTLADWAREVEKSALQKMLAVASRPGVTSFACGLPAAELFPTEEYGRAAARVLDTDRNALQYEPPFRPLKSHVVRLMKLRGVDCQEGQVFLTTGAQQGMNLVARLLLNPGGTVLMEELIYSGFRQLVEPFRPRVLTVPTDMETGMDVEAVEALLAAGERPAFIYAISDGHNPLGVSMSERKRERLVAAARRYRVPVIEDDAYGFISYEGEAVAPMRAREDEWVFYVGTFSKVLAPALRVGWVLLPEELSTPVSALKEASDIDTATFAQRSISAFLDGGSLPEHISMLRREYRLRRDVMLEALREHFPSTARWRKPSHGLFVWVELDPDVDTEELLEAAVEEERVAFIPGSAFYIGSARPARNALRLNFSNPSPAEIEDGIRRLGRLLRRRS